MDNTSERRYFMQADGFSDEESDTNDAKEFSSDSVDPFVELSDTQQQLKQDAEAALATAIENYVAFGGTYNEIINIVNDVI